MPKILLVMMMSMIGMGFLFTASLTRGSELERAGLLSGVTPPNAAVLVSNRAGTARQAHAGQPVYVADVISTTANQTARVTLDDNSELVLAPSGRLEVSALRSGDGGNRAILRLLYGTLRTLVRRAYVGKDVFQVATPTSVMGVRGTHFVADYDSRNGESTLHVFHGTVAMTGGASGGGQPTLVKGGFQSAFRPGGAAPSTPERFDPAKYDEQLRNLSPEFESQLGTEEREADASGRGANKTLSDALREHDEKNGDDGDGGSQRNLRGGGPSLSGGGGGQMQPFNPNPLTRPGYSNTPGTTQPPGDTTNQQPPAPAPVAVNPNTGPKPNPQGMGAASQAPTRTGH